MKPFNICYSRIQTSGNNTRLELRKEFRADIERRGGSLEHKTQAAMSIQDEEEDGCVVVKMYIKKTQPAA